MRSLDRLYCTTKVGLHAVFHRSIAAWQIDVAWPPPAPLHAYWTVSDWNASIDAGRCAVLNSPTLYSNTLAMSSAMSFVVNYRSLQCVKSHRAISQNGSAANNVSNEWFHTISFDYNALRLTHRVHQSPPVLSACCMLSPSVRHMSGSVGNGWS